MNMPGTNDVTLFSGNLSICIYLEAELHQSTGNVQTSWPTSQTQTSKPVTYLRLFINLASLPIPLCASTTDIA